MKNLIPVLLLAFSVVACSDASLTGAEMDSSPNNDVLEAPAARSAAAQSAQYDSFFDIILSLEGDFTKFYEKGNKAAGTRVRKGMQDLKNLSKDTRKGIKKMLRGGGSGNGGRARVELLDNPYEQVKGLMESMEDDFVKFFEKGNRAAGTRLLAGLRDFEKLTKAVDKDVKKKSKD